MTFPGYVPTRTVTVGAAAVLESAVPLTVRVSVASSKSLVWDATGDRFVAGGVLVNSTSGAAATVLLPCTDVPGWRDAASNALIDVSAPNSYTHQYTAVVTFQDATGAQVMPAYAVGPFVLPQGDGSTVDLDKLVPASTVAGQQVSIPDEWSATLDALPGTYGPGGTAGNINKHTAQGIALVQALIFGGN
jgi:hypothetical protein